MLSAKGGRKEHKLYEVEPESACFLLKCILILSLSVSFLYRSLSLTLSSSALALVIKENVYKKKAMGEM